jgi:acetyltransferase-like isoleucine patch superfamily enzyme
MITSRLLNWLSRSSTRLASGVWRYEARLKGLDVDGDSLFMGRPILSRHAESTIRIGQGLRCYSAPRANLIACAQPCVIRTLAPGSRLVLGRRVGISAAVIVAANSVEIGDDTQIGSGAMIVDNDFHSLDAQGRWGDLDASQARPVRLGERVFVGARAIILKGVTVGDDSVIGAGSVVTKSVPSRHLAVGNPASVRPLSVRT